jgi:hypothetical protein
MEGEMRTSAYVILLFVCVAGACAGSEKGDAAAGGDELAPQDTPSDRLVAADERTGSPGAWWEQGPAPDEEPPPGTETKVVSADLECIGEDPFYHLFTCPGACHYLVGTIDELSEVADGHVSEFGNSKYFVADTRTATVTIETWLASPPVFDDAPFSAPPTGSFVVQEQHRGYADIYLETQGVVAPTYQETLWDKEWVVPPYAQIPAKGTVVLGFKDAHDVVHPDHRLVTVIFPLTVDGRVDMTALQGTNVTVEAGWPANTPTEPISIDEAKKWFQEMVTFNGARCFPSEVEDETQTELPGE